MSLLAFAIVGSSISLTTMPTHETQAEGLARKAGRRQEPPTSLLYRWHQKPTMRPWQVVFRLSVAQAP
jgi:hypothetical protein